MKVLAPRVPTPAVARSGRATSRLPEDVVAEQVARLKLTALISAGLWGVGLVINGLIAPLMLAQPVSLVGMGISITAITTSLAVYLYVRYTPRTPHHCSDAGLGLMILNAFDIALLETWAQPISQLRVGQVSWIVVVILISAMVVPSTPRKMLAATLVAASMGPLGIFIAYLRGLDVPSLFATFLIYLPNYTCGIAGVLPSYMFQRLGARLREARELGSYELLELLGNGGMGEVWRARHRLLARHAAIKLVRPELLGTAGPEQAKAVLRRFEREAQATAALSSQHSIRLFDFGATDDGSFYYVMELLTGRDLESLVREFGPMPSGRVMYLLRQVCHSLAEAHERGLIHRDIKPANIYVCRMGLDYDFIKVLDFGLVKFRDQDAASIQTQSLMTLENTMMGTPAYMAPEVILGVANVDRRADVYAIGCVAYFMLTGQLVFEGETRMQTLVDHVHEPVVPPSERSELPVPRDLDRIVVACLEKDPGKRPQDAAQLLRLLLACSACGGWGAAEAAEWWQRHLPELTGPMPITDAAPEPAAVR